MDALCQFKTIVATVSHNSGSNEIHPEARPRVASIACLSTSTTANAVVSPMRFVPFPFFFLGASLEISGNRILLAQAHHGAAETKLCTI